jgi:lipopolysaccharide export system ATP-binding protein
MPDSVVLAADGLNKSFGRKAVLKAASFSAKRGVITALMGRNGAGKSTMLRVAIGRVRADYGRVLFHGELLRRPNLAWMARRGLFYSAQDSALTDLFTVREQLDAVARVHGREDRVPEAVVRWSLDDLLDRRPLALAGGERKRASLALALVREPTCLLMDEPFLGIAPKDRGLVTEGLQALRAQGCAIVISGHDVEDVFDVSDEVVWVVSGTTHVLGSPEAARAHHQFSREYLGG